MYYIKLPQTVFDLLLRLPKHQRLTFGYLKQFSDYSTHISKYVSYNEIAEHCKTHPANIRKGIAALQEQDWIRKIDSAGSKHQWELTIIKAYQGQPTADISENPPVPAEVVPINTEDRFQEYTYGGVSFLTYSNGSRCYRFNKTMDCFQWVRHKSDIEVDAWQNGANYLNDDAIKERLKENPYEIVRDIFGSLNV